MKVRLTAIGTSLGVVLDNTLLESLSIQPETELEITTNGESIILRPIRESKKSRIKEASEKMMNVHSETLQKLSD